MRISSAPFIRDNRRKQVLPHRNDESRYNAVNKHDCCKSTNTPANPSADHFPTYKSVFVLKHTLVVKHAPQYSSSSSLVASSSPTPTHPTHHMPRHALQPRKHRYQDPATIPLQTATLPRTEHQQLQVWVSVCLVFCDHTRKEHTKKWWGIETKVSKSTRNDESKFICLKQAVTDEVVMTFVGFKLILFRVRASGTDMAPRRRCRRRNHEDKILQEVKATINVIE